jgi:hypothetical protein
MGGGDHHTVSHVLQGEKELVRELQTSIEAALGHGEIEQEFLLPA